MKPVNLNNEEIELKSKCCNAPMTVFSSDEEACYYVCEKCKMPTDPKVGSTPKEEEAPMGVSKWRNHGIRMGYWDYFKKEIKKDIEYQKQLSFNECFAKCLNLHKEEISLTKNKVMIEELEHCEEAIKIAKEK